MLTYIWRQTISKEYHVNHSSRYIVNICVIHNTEPQYYNVTELFSVSKNCHMKCLWRNNLVKCCDFAGSTPGSIPLVNLQAAELFT